MNARKYPSIRESQQHDDSAATDGPSGVVVAFPRNGVRPLTQRRDEIKALFSEQHLRLVRFLTLRLGSEEEAEEVAQDSFLRLLERDSVAPESNPRALLYVIARGYAIDRVRQRRRRRRYQVESSIGEDGEPLDVATDDLTPERIVSAQQQVHIIDRLMAELSVKCRYAFIRYKFHGSEYATIASELGVTESMVRKYVIRAVCHCAARLRSSGGGA